ncbi:MAG: CPBP family intramembrane metalloprotease [Candidatus Marinimicrobia bacterium]|nr:CPBP family intramembrane metalloprotease [Candidatus Neomarinimicrobiota bacterium]MCH8305359.1 CPBP family intramembrane metalloprotease [Candidatus Neomarinimicrobiota bacterium]
MWFVLFSPWTKSLINFWIGMTSFSASLALTSLVLARDKTAEIFEFKRSYIWIGIISAAILYLIFFIGDMAVRSLFDFAKVEIENIYSTKSQASTIKIGLLLLFVIAPAEEIFWRGFVQRRYSERWGKWRGLVLAVTLYSLVHIWSFNLMLIAAAMVAGIFWSLLYLKYNSIVPGIISHAVWDLFIFVIYPIK